MHRIREWLRRLWYLVNRRAIEDALREEMDAHREMLEDPARFGPSLRLREAARDVWGWGWLDRFVLDVRLASRMLRRTPVYSLVAVLSLSLTMALAAATTAVVNAYLIRSLPYPESSRLFHVRYAPPGPYEPGGMSAIDWPALGDIVEHAITSSGDTFYLTGGPPAESSRGLRVSSGFIEALGIDAVLGRPFSAQDFRADGDRVAIIGARLWRERFNADPNVVGRMFSAEMELQGGPAEAFRVVGVLPDGFWFGRDSRDLVDILVPLRARARTYMIRLRAGVPVAHAQLRITDAARRVGTSVSPDWKGVELEAAHERYVAQVRPVLLGVTGAATLVLVIVCANLAVLALLRATSRQVEIGVRVALGAGRRHLIRMFVVEACVLVAVAVAVGLTLAGLTMRLFVPVIATQLGRPAPGGDAAVRMDVTVWLTVVGLAALIAVVLPMLPLLAPWAHPLAASGRRGSRTTTDGPAARRWRTSLIAFEVAGSLTLLVGCGLMVRSVVNMVRTDYGIRTADLVRVGVDFPGRLYADPLARLAVFERLTDRIAALSQSAVPLFHWPQFAETPKQPVQVGSPDGPTIDVGVVPVGPHYFSTLAIPVRQGRVFGPADRLGTEPIAVVSEALARRLWPDTEAIGKRVRVADHFISGSLATGWRTVVGVVADVRQGYGDQDLGDIYIPFLQAPPNRYAWVYVRTDRLGPTWQADLSAVVAHVDPRILIRIAVPLAAEGERPLATPRFLATMLSSLALFAVFLAALGLYGVTAFAVQQREREVAIRLALGALGGTVVRMFLRQGGRVLAIGIAVGLPGAGALAHVLAAHLHGVPPIDGGTFLATTAIMIAVGLGATWWPARRAAGKRPFEVLKEG